MLVVVNTGEPLRVALSGDTASATTLPGGFEPPTSVILARGWVWGSQDPLGRLFARPPQPPHLPFSVVRVKRQDRGQASASTRPWSISRSTTRRAAVHCRVRYGHGSPTALVASSSGNRSAASTRTQPADDCIQVPTPA